MDKYLAQLGVSGPVIVVALWILVIAEIIKVGKIIWDFVAPKILGIQTTVSKEKKYRKQIEDNNIKLNEYLDNQNEINKGTTEALSNIIDRLEVLSGDVIDLKIEEMRQKILDFASAVNDGRLYTKEQYNFIRKLYHTYEDFILRTGKTNDEVEISMEIINSYYAYCVKHHCFVEDRLNDARIQSMLHTLDPDEQRDSEGILYDTPNNKKKSSNKGKGNKQQSPSRRLVRDNENEDSDND